MSNTAATSKDSSYDSFATVDKLVNKPILGSDGAASWQTFRSSNPLLSKKKQSSSGAPSLQVKQKDRLGTGFITLEQERENDNRIRKQAGDVPVGAGYVHFQRKPTEDASISKQNKRIRARVRPDEQEYFLHTEGIFQGYKFDYIFTTRDGRTGYYWDGTDSLDKLNGTTKMVPKNNVKNKNASNHTSSHQDPSISEQPRKKKTKTATFVNDSASTPNIGNNTTNSTSMSSNHYEIVERAIRKRQEAMIRPPDVLLQPTHPLPFGWKQASDPASQTVYYYQEESGQRQWEMPRESSKEISLPDGWSSAKDASTGKEYYYHSNGETKWERPTNSKC